MGHYVNQLAEVKTFLPWVSLLAGLGGGLHCVGMCGGLVTASCEGSRDIFRYQLGRLVGYLLLGIFAGSLGSLLNVERVPPIIALIPSFIIGLLFIYWGILNFYGRKAEIPSTKFVRKIYYTSWTIFVQENKNFSRAFFTGLISILLPCGLLYGVVIGTLSLQDASYALMSMFFFWLGTVPSMVAAPQIVQKMFKPLKTKLPKIYALSLVLIGIVTISIRVSKIRIDLIESHTSTVGEKTLPDVCH